MAHACGAPPPQQQPQPQQQQQPARPTRARHQVFFLWSGVFTLISLSLFWSVMACVFLPAESVLYYGLVCAGGTGGQVLGSVRPPPRPPSS